MSLSERLLYDLEQATKLASTMDQNLFKKESELKEFGIHGVLEKVSDNQFYKSTKQKLDLVIAYIRRVHHFIYYAGVQCLDMGDVMHAHPALFCRPQATERDIEEAKV